MFSEKAKRNQAILVECVNQWISIDRHRRRVEYDLIQSCELLKEKGDTRSDENIDWDRSSLDYDAHMKIVFTLGATLLHVSEREFTVNESLVKVKDKGFATFMLW